VSSKTAENNVNYQERAAEFAPGDIVVPFGLDDSLAGRVTAVWPGIGMVDVEFAVGNKRIGVEELTRINPDNTIMSPPFTDSVPGGPGTVRVPGGPVAPVPEAAKVEASTSRVAQAFVKKSLYWSGPDRQYKAPAAEVATGHYTCPKCRARGIQSPLKPAAYKRREGVSEKLLGCNECLFLVKRSDIVNCPSNIRLDEVA
jgi:hypothetical protein